MKRKIITLTLITLLTASLIGCGKKTDEVSTTDVSTTEVSTIESTIDETDIDEKTSTDESITDESSISTDSTNTVSDNNTTVSDNEQSNDEIVDNNSSDDLIEVIPGVWGKLDEEASIDGKLVYTTDDGVEYTIDTIKHWSTIYTISDEIEEICTYTDENFTNMDWHSIDYKNINTSDPDAIAHEEWYYDENGTVTRHITEYSDGFFTIDE